mmetsp:Transcript_16307/g.45137  ORF Transcript_16307/g.45137 Transcript_16307/m.45137 type:complete len:227 (-) Transcript_16307:1686-2366(-)
MPGCCASSQRRPPAMSCSAGGATKTRGRAAGELRLPRLGLWLRLLTPRSPLDEAPRSPMRPPDAVSAGGGARTQLSNKARRVRKPKFTAAASMTVPPPPPRLPPMPSPPPFGLRTGVPKALCGGSCGATSASLGSALKHCATSKYTERLPSAMSQVNHVGTDTGLLTMAKARFMTSSALFLPGWPNASLGNTGAGISTHWPLVASQSAKWSHASRTKTCRLLSKTL